jgi:predicted ATP-grasp superfamily ATP-dependent carboligase
MPSLVALAEAPQTITASPSQRESHPPVILMGGGANALSVARSLGRAGIRVFALNHPHEYVCASRYCSRLSVHGSEDAWAEFLLGSASDSLQGAILLACNDPALELIAKHRAALAERFTLDDSNPQAQLCMLNKLCTYKQAVAAGVATPRFWVVNSRQQIIDKKDEFVYPLLVKPVLSHVFDRRFNKKFFDAQNFTQLLEGFGHVEEAGIEVMLVEKIPGPDDRSCSYYTYLDENSRPLFHFTKRNLRRYPVNMGGACYHVTAWMPEVIEPSLKLFRQVGLRGLAHVEYKRDDRDGRLKLIECNARFTAANCLVAASGFDLAQFVYNRLTGRPQAPLDKFETGLYLWDPRADFHAFLELRRRGELTFRQWLKSLGSPKFLTFFRWHDPWPSVATEFRRLKGYVTRRLSRLFSWLK